MTPDEGTTSGLLEARDFLLRSLDDLERERAEGGIDDETYGRLHGDYTARAAAVLRELRRGAPVPEPTPASSPPAVGRRRIAIVGGILAFAAVAGFLLVQALGDRSPGGTATGNQQLGGAESTESVVETRARLEEEVAANPDDPAAYLALARFLVQADPAAALRTYDEVLVLEPDNAEAHAYGAWLVHLAGLPEEALPRVDRAIAADPSFADAYFFRGMILFQGLGDPAAAVAAFDRYLELAPEGALSDQVRQVRDAAAGAVDTGATRNEPPTSPPTGEE